MGFSNKVQSSANYLKIKGLKKEDPTHYWELDGEVLEDNVFTGKLIKINGSSYEFEGVERQTIKLLFVDDLGEHFQLDISYNGISRNLLNTLIGYVEGANKQGAKTGRVDLELSLYINKAGYKQMGISINGARGDWRYSIDEQRKLIERIETKAGVFVSNDYSAYDKVLKEGIEKVSAFLTVKIEEETPEKDIVEEAKDVFE